MLSDVELAERLVALNLDPKDRGCFSKVLDQEAVGDDLLDAPELQLVGDDGAVIDIKCNNGQVVASTNIDAQVQVSGFKVGLAEMGVNGAIPLKQCLLEAIEALQQAPDVVGSLLVHKPLRLGDVNLLSELGVEKHHVNIDLVDLEVVCVHEGK